MAIRQCFHQLLELRRCGHMLALVLWCEGSAARLKRHHHSADHPKQQWFRQTVKQQKRPACFEWRQRRRVGTRHGCCPHHILSAHRVPVPTAKHDMGNTKGHGMGCHDRTETSEVWVWMHSRAVTFLSRGAIFQKTKVLEKATFLYTVSAKASPHLTTSPFHSIAAYSSRICLCRLNL